MKTNMTFLQKAKRFFEPMKQDKKVYYAGYLVYFVWAVDVVIHILFLERIVYFLEKQNTELFLTTLTYYTGYISFYIIFTFLTYDKGWTTIFNTATKYLQNKYLAQFVVLDNNNVEKEGTGKLTAIVKTGIDRWAAFLESFIDFFTSIIISIIFTSYMLWKSNVLFLFIFVAIYIFVLILSYFLNSKILPIREKKRDYGNLNTKNLIKILMNKQEIMQTNRISYELEILDHYNDKEIFYYKKMASYMMIMYELPNVLLTILIIVLLYILGTAFLSGNMGISTIVGITGALVLMQTSIENALDLFKDFTKNFTDIDKLWEFFDEAPKIQGYETGEDFMYKKGDISLKNVDYSYVKGKNILENFSLHIPGGKVIAFVGNSGGGKSTIAKLIAGYISCESGNIEIDNQNLKNISLKSYYKNIGYLTQEPSVFDGSVLENLYYALETEPAYEQIDEIIKLAKCEFIYDLPNGVETEIGERGVKLSGGQRQRLAIAKIMLKDPKIIILDEPTSALDSFSEEQITKAMNNLFENRTVIVIAHRLQTVKHADKIFVIENGKVVEEGTHTELQKEKGVYYKMLELQSGF